MGDLPPPPPSPHHYHGDPPEANGIAHGVSAVASKDSNEAHRTWIKINRWQSVMRPLVRFVMHLAWFRQRGLVFLHDSTIALSRA